MSDGNSGASYICFYTSDRQNHTYAFYLKKKKIFRFHKSLKYHKWTTVQQHSSENLHSSREIQTHFFSNNLATCTCRNFGVHKGTQFNILHFQFLELGQFSIRWNHINQNVEHWFTMHVRPIFNKRPVLSSDGNQCRDSGRMEQMWE